MPYPIHPRGASSSLASASGFAAPHTNRLSVGEPRDAHHQQVTTSSPLLPLFLPPQEPFYILFLLFSSVSTVFFVYVLFSPILSVVLWWWLPFPPLLRAREGLPHRTFNNRIRAFGGPSILTKIIWMCY